MRLLFLIPLVAAAQQGAVEGVALNRVTKAPVAGVKVRMTAVAERGRFHEAVTGIDGRYRIDNLPAGEYTPMVTAPGGMYGPPIQELIVTKVLVSDKAATYDVAIWSPAVVRGRVLDADRRPVARAQVVAVPVAGIQPGMSRTDSEGRFELSLGPGRYRLRAQPPPSGGWAPTFFPNATEPSSAETIVVGEGGGLDGLDIRLRPAATGRLSGIVLDDEGKPAAGVDLSLSGNDALLSSGPKVTSGPKGEFEFKAVPPGEWLLLGSAGRNDVRWMGTARVTMPDRDFDRAEVRIYPPFALDVELEGLPDERSTPVSLDLRPAAGFILRYAQERDGAARFDRVYPGSYRVGVRGFNFVPGRYLKSILVGAVDITGQQVELGPASPPLRFVFAPNPGRISGEVENGARARVVLMWADRDNYVPGADSINVTCNESGRFTMGDLRPGAWYALAFSASTTPQSADAIRDRVFNQGLWRDATSFRVAEGETATLKLKILP